MSESEQERRNRLSEMYAMQQGESAKCAFQQLQGQGLSSANLYAQGGQLGNLAAIGGLGYHQLTQERQQAIREQMVRLAHSYQDTPERVVVRADAYLSFILNGTQKESIIDGED